VRNDPFTKFTAYLAAVVLVMFLAVSGWFISIPNAQWHHYANRVSDPSVVFAQTNYTNCEQSRTQTTVSGSTSGTSAVKIVSLIAGDPIYVCSGFVVGTSGTTPTFSLVTGTGTNCASNQVTVVASFGTAANTPVIFPGPFTAATPAGYELCYLDGGTTPVQFYSFNIAQQ
jgi:hypothetical protein